MICADAPLAAINRKGKNGSTEETACIACRYQPPRPFGLTIQAMTRNGDTPRGYGGC
jgi:hypothetical protein